MSTTQLHFFYIDIGNQDVKIFDLLITWRIHNKLIRIYKLYELKSLIFYMKLDFELLQDNTKSRIRWNGLIAVNSLATFNNKNNDNNKNRSRVRLYDLRPLTDSLPIHFAVKYHNIYSIAIILKFSSQIAHLSMYFLHFIKP